MENQIKNLFLDYGAHLFMNCEFVGFKTNKYGEKQEISQLSLKDRKNKKKADKLGKSGLLSQNYMANCLANLFLVVSKLAKNNARLLFINGNLSTFNLTLSTRQGAAKPPVLGYKTLCNTDKINHVKTLDQPLSKHKPSNGVLQGAWIHGACSNWSRLCKVAWNSHKLLNLRNTLDSTMHIESWVLEAESLFRGLHGEKNPFAALRATRSAAKANNPIKEKLTYRHKPDCIILINPSPGTVKECKTLNVPICICSSTTDLKVAGSYLKSNQESPFLTYLIFCLFYAQR